MKKTIAVLILIAVACPGNDFIHRPRRPRPETYRYITDVLRTMTFYQTTNLLWQVHLPMLW